MLIWTSAPVAQYRLLAATGFANVKIMTATQTTAIAMIRFVPSPPPARRALGTSRAPPRRRAFTQKRRRPVGGSPSRALRSDRCTPTLSMIPRMLRHNGQRGRYAALVSGSETGGTFKSTRCLHGKTNAHDRPRSSRGEGDNEDGGVQRWRVRVRDHVARVEPPRSLRERGVALRRPHQGVAAFFAFVTSFVSVLIMWMNHHNMFNYIRKIDRRLMLL